jgi:hypothetical protein
MVRAGLALNDPPSPRLQRGRRRNAESTNDELMLMLMLVIDERDWAQKSEDKNAEPAFAEASARQAPNMRECEEQRARREESLMLQLQKWTR